MKLEEVKTLLKEKNQEQLLKFYDELSDEQREKLLEQISEIDFSLIDTIDNEGDASPKGEITPIRDVASIKDIADNHTRFEQVGLEAIEKGEVAALLLAGGMGTRLGSDKPKGMFNIGETKDLFIFECIVNNLMDVVDKAGKWIPFFIMTSEKNDADTRAFFEEHEYFGYNPEFIDFFKQEMAPACDFNGKIFLEEKDRVATSPNGNGGWYISLINAGLRDKAKEMGVKYLNAFSVDNVLQRMADPVFVGAMIDGDYRSASKVVAKTEPTERVGCMCLEDGKPSIVEYYELTDEMAHQKLDTGEYAYNYGVTLNYLFTIEDLEKNVETNMPVHVVRKKIVHVDDDGNTVRPEEENGFKFETLILDMVHQMDDCLAYEVDRKKEFAPIKNRTGVDSVDTAKELLKLNGVEL